MSVPLSVCLSVCLYMCLSACLSVPSFASEVGVIIMNIKYFISFLFHTPHEAVVVAVIISLGDLFGISEMVYVCFGCRFVVVVVALPAIVCST